MGSKKLCKRSFLGRTAAHSLQPHPFEADSATRPSQAGFFIKDELSDYRFLVDTGAFRSILPPPGDFNTITTTLLHLISSQPTVLQSARMVNNKSTYVFPAKHTPGPSS